MRNRHRKKSDTPRTEEERLREARGWALRILGRRARSESEMRDRLRRRGYSDGVIRRCLQSLRRAGALDDEQFAREYAAHARRRNPMGRRRLEQELQKRGVGRGLAREVAGEITPQEEERLAKEALQRRGGPPSADLPREERLRELRRLFGYLSRRGFPPGLIRRLLPLDDIGGRR